MLSNFIEQPSTSTTTSAIHSHKTTNNNNKNKNNNNTNSNKEERRKRRRGAKLVMTSCRRMEANNNAVATSMHKVSIIGQGRAGG